MRRLLSSLLVGTCAVALIAVTAVPAAATDVAIEVTGRVMYEDADGVMQPVARARVDVCDDDRFLGVGNDCEIIGFSQTHDDGEFRIPAFGGDIEGPPDVWVRVNAESSNAIVVTDFSFSLGKYCMATDIRSDFTAATLDVGDMTPDSTNACFGHGEFADLEQERVGWQLFDFVNEVSEIAESEVGSLDPVEVVWPHELNGVAWYLPLLGVGRIHITENAKDSRQTMYHEYGHHVLYQKAESPIPDYNNDVCDETNPLRDLPFFGGHCFWDEERGSIHWTEGFPNFFAEFALEQNTPGSQPMRFPFDIDGDNVADFNLTSEHPWLPDSGDSPSPAGNDNEQTEGWTHVVLHDLWDDIASPAENRDEATDPHDSSDRVQLDFADLWDVIQTDPDPDDIFHNHPTTLEEFRQLLVAAHPDLANRIAAVFTENDMFRRGSDLGAADVVAPNGTTVVRGGVLRVGDTTFNADNARHAVGEESRTQYLLGDQVIGSRVVPDLDPGDESTATLDVTVPTSINPGTYFLRACADGPGVIFETGTSSTADMVENCASGPIVTVENRSPTADAGGPYEFSEGAGGTLTAVDSSDPDGDTLTYLWSAAAGVLSGSVTGETVELSDTVDDGQYAVSVEVRDPFGGVDSDAVTVTVTNVAPTVDAGADVNQDEGLFVTRLLTIVDPGPDTFTATVDWGNGTPVPVPVVGTSLVISHRYGDDADTTAQVCVRDDEDAEGCDSFEVDIANVAPDLGATPVEIAADEGSTTTGSAPFTDPGDDDWTADVTWGDGQQTQPTVPTREVPLSHTYAQDGSYLGQVCVDDDDGDSDCVALTATITNVAPFIVDVDVAQPVLALVQTSLAATFTDPGVQDSHTATIDWGDGGGLQAASLTEPSVSAAGGVTGAHTYAAEGTFPIEVCITDDDDTTCRTTAIEVLSPAAAAAAAVEDLAGRGSDDPAVIAALAALDGADPDSDSGALDKLRDEDWNAGLVKLADAIAALEDAETDESALQSVLTLIAEAVARQRAAEVDALGLTSKGALKKVARIATDIAAGREAYDAENFIKALQRYQAATQTAVELLT